ncbi:MAG: hypothetical protein KA109_01785 [Saprospiraceae bacterium]|nr:hypothetical protein [Saprospiraceae bacterium]MBK9679300.1 hypothetical protein [Saprospiraceae bacterium]MBP7800330.1 hypothetical protein [Saprospiraceae bacterium]MBP8097059.1 hypothetical protein [Saprospiraceae bacterium]MBP8942544.1 hypothetical protein [Saprospiraceae bacterium]
MKSKFLLGCIALSTLFVISCEKSSEVPTADSDQAITNVTINATEAQDALASVEELENELLEARDNGTCPTISSTQPRGSFPNVVTIDFGSGCLTKSGRYHSGQIIVEQSDSMSHNGALRKTTFVNFGIDSFRVKNGVITLSNEGKDADSNHKFSRKISGITVNGPKGTLTLEASHTSTQIEGGLTPGTADDIWKITGETKGSTEDKIVFSSTITDPLVRKGNCPYLVSGQEEFLRKGHTVQVNYGDGSCDRFAKATTENGKSFVIILRNRF